MSLVLIPQRSAQRCDTAANWAAKNPVLADGEIGIERDVPITSGTRLKIGDGVTHWNDLPYFSTEQPA